VKKKGARTFPLIFLPPCAGFSNDSLRSQWPAFGFRGSFFRFLADQLDVSCGIVYKWQRMSDRKSMERGHSCPHRNTAENIADKSVRAPVFYTASSPPVHKYKHVLPHWERAGTWVFITWRLGDALPVAALHALRLEKERWIAEHPEPWDVETEREYHRRFSRRVDRWLDEGMGCCALRKRNVAERVAKVLKNGDGETYELQCFAIMPNHVHVLARFCPNTDAHRTLKAWKGVSARRINSLLSRKGALWQEGYWDRLIRSAAHWETVRSYILENPAKAGLRSGFVLFDQG